MWTGSHNLTASAVQGVNCESAVVLEGTHLCAVMRGVNQPSGIMRTQALRGRFHDDPTMLRDLLGVHT